MFELRGMLPALITPFDKEGNVNFTVLCDLIEWHIAAGLTGMYICGSTGEGLLMTEEERRSVAEAVVKQVHGRVPVVVHVGTLQTEVACRLAAHAQAIGADGTSSVPPFYYNVGTYGVKEYYRHVAAAAPALPFYIYNIPALTNVSMNVELVSEMLKEIPNLRGMKFTASDFYAMRKIIELDEGRFNVVSGPDEMMLAAQAMGADGAIGTTQNMIPHVFVQAYSAFHAGDVKKAEGLQAKINHVVNAFLSFPGSGGVKEIMRLQGFDCGVARAPLVPLNETQRGQLREMLENIGFFQFARF